MLNITKAAWYYNTSTSKSFDFQGYFPQDTTVWLDLIYSWLMLFNIEW